MGVTSTGGSAPAPSSEGTGRPGPTGRAAGSAASVPSAPQRASRVPQPIPAAVPPTRIGSSARATAIRRSPSAWRARPAAWGRAATGSSARRCSTTARSATSGRGPSGAAAGSAPSGRRRRASCLWPSSCSSSWRASPASAMRCRAPGIPLRSSKDRLPHRTARWCARPASTRRPWRTRACARRKAPDAVVLDVGRVTDTETVASRSRPWATTSPTRTCWNSPTPQPRGWATTPYDFTGFYEHIAPAIRSYDIAFVNQETTLGGPDAYGYNGYPSYNTPDSMADAVADAGWRVVSTNTNHAYDTWTSSIEHAQQVWASKSGELLTVGSFTSRRTASARAWLSAMGCASRSSRTTTGRTATSNPICQRLLRRDLRSRGHARGRAARPPRRRCRGGVHALGHRVRARAG